MRISDWSSDVCSSDLLFNCLEIMGLRAASQDPIMERMIGAVLALRSQRREAVGAAGLGLAVTTDLTWLSAAWRKHVLPKALVAARPGWYPRQVLQLAVLAPGKDGPQTAACSRP